MQPEELVFDTEQRIGLKISSRVLSALAARRIGIKNGGAPFDHLIFPKTVTVEAYSSFPQQNEFYDLGAFSYAETNHYLGRVKVGRYTSIASDVEAFGERHPSEWVTQSMITYDASYPGLRMAHEDFRGGLGEPAVFPDRFGQEITIGHDVWIGRHVQIARGVDIGHGAVVAAGSVVTRNIAPYLIVGGVPARPIRRRFSAGVGEKLLASEWWNYSPKLLWALDFTDPEGFCDRLAQAKLTGAASPFTPIKTTAADLLADLAS